MKDYKTYKWSIHLFGHWTLTISNCRLKRRHDQTRRLASKQKRKIRTILLERQEGICPMCSRELKDDITIHHIRSVKTHPELYNDVDNCVLMHHSCHNMLHTEGACINAVKLLRGYPVASNWIPVPEFENLKMPEE